MRDPTYLRQTFAARSGRTPRAFFAPGRVNLIGEHTDYNDGFVLPMALELGTTVLAAPRDDRRVRVHTHNLGARGEFDLDKPGPGKTGRWLDYVEGVAQALEARGHTLRGADMVLSSDVPRGAGLSSSASLEIAIGFALLSIASLTIDRKTLAKAGQEAEHRYVGTLCGIMDQLVAACGAPGSALLVDCRSLETKDVRLPPKNIAILVTDTRKKHSLASSEYNTRRAECERAVELLREALPKVHALRDVDAKHLEQNAALLPDLLLRRARHVVTENARTLAAARALGEGDMASVGALFVASHRSLQHDYEVSSPELDHLVDTATSLPGVFGARMTGGGFGGSTVSLVDAEKLDGVVETLRASYRARFGKEPGFLVTRGGTSACELSLS